MADLATLGLRIDGTQLVAAERNLQTFARTAQTTEQRVQGVNQQTAAASRGFNQLNNVLRSVVIQATGADPVVGRLATTISAFAIQGAMMTGVLAGIAGVVAGFRAITADARAAREESERLKNVLIQVQGAYTPAGLDIGAGIAEQTRIIADLQAEKARIQGATLASGQPSWRQANRLAEIEQEMSEARGLVIAGEARLRSIFGDRADERAKRMEEQGRAYAEGYEFTGPRMGDGGLPQLGTTTRFDLVDRKRVEGQAASLRGASEAAMRSVDRWMDQRTRAENDLQAARERANASLVLGLANVGRAYGGVTDQVLNLAAATLSLERMPMVSGSDKARAYGSAALTGIGYGASTGSPALGGLGGAASGFAMAGPYGALIGGISGIVSGLFEQGQRAQQAARLWKMAMEDYALLFDDLTPTQQNERQNRRAFMQASGGLTPEQVQELLRINGGGRGRDYAIEHLTDFTRQQLEELNHWYIENGKQAGELANAERELYDARFRSLNAPSGFNAAAFGYYAGASYQPDKDKGVTVVVLVDGEEVAARVERRTDMRYKRGATPALSSR